jgi:flagellar L-ring protein FlgH
MTRTPHISPRHMAKIYLKGIGGPAITELVTNREKASTRQLLLSLALKHLLVGCTIVAATACTTTSNKAPVLPGPVSAPVPAISPVATPPPRPSPPQGITAGSLYTDSGASFYEDVKARKVGDIVTITVSEKAEASKQASTKTGRKKDLSADLSFTGLTAGGNVVLDTLQSGYSGKFDTNFTGTGTSSRKDSMTTYMTATIVEILPNGNFAIRGSRWTKVNEELQQIVLEGIIRPMDITRQNEILSQKIADAKIFFVGKGPVSNQARPGWLMRVFDAVNPF